MQANYWYMLVTSLFVGAAAGYLGSFMVLKKMSLVGDALSHVALPGMAIALVWGQSPILGAFLALAIAVLGIWSLQGKSDLGTETLVGLFFTTSLALGVLITPQPELLEALFGNLEKVNAMECIVGIIASLTVLGIMFRISKKMVLGVISEELAIASGVNIRIVNLVYLLMVGAVVALGVRIIGTMLMGALVIIPAASARNISNSITRYYFFSTLFGIISAAVGVTVAYKLGLSSGPIVVLAGIVIFAVTFIFRLKKS